MAVSILLMERKSAGKAVMVMTYDVGQTLCGYASTSAISEERLPLVMRGSGINWRKNIGLGLVRSTQR